MKYLIITLLILTCASCKPEESPDNQKLCEQHCFDPSVIPYFTGYKAEEIDTVIVRSFDSADHSFKNVLSEKMYRNPDTINVGDRVVYPDSFLRLSSSNNHQIVVPATGTVHQLNFHTQKHSVMTACHRFTPCANGVDMHMVDSVSVPLEFVHQNHILAIKVQRK